MYLEDQTDGLVQSITSLVDAIRGDEAMATIRSYIMTIASTIENITSSVERTGNEPSSYQARLIEKSRPIVTILQDCRSKLLRADNDASSFESKLESKEFTQ